MKSTVKIVIKIILAAITALFIVNALCFGYNHLPKAYTRSTNATEMVWNPDSYIIHSSEGLGFYSVDKNGYLNKTTPDEFDSYILVLGASHTEGKEVLSGQRYTDILNTRLQEDHQNCLVYNMGMDSHYFDKLVSGFTSAMQEFPDADAVILEVSELNFSRDELERALIQRPYDKEQKAEMLKKKAGFKERFMELIKENIPFLTVVRTQFADYEVDLSKAFGLKQWMKSDADEQKEGISESEYYEAFYEMASLLRNAWNKEIIILYHPSVEVTYEGDLICDYPDNYNVFREACIDSGLTFCDVGQAYVSAWQSDYTLPRGFQNTTFGYGHINKAGHQIIADELYSIIKKE